MMLNVNPWGLLLLIACMISHSSFSQSLSSCRQEIYEGYATGNQARWEKGIQGLEALMSKEPSYPIQYELLLAQYGLVGFLLSQEGKQAQAATQLEKSLAGAKACLEQYPNKGEVMALIGGMYGLKIGLSPARGIYLGPRSLRYLNDGKKTSPQHPGVWVELANAKYHSPALFGGDNQEAITYFSKAISLFEKSPSYDTNWLYLHSMAWLGQAYEKEKDWKNAEKTYKAALAKWPNFDWVKDTLLPKLTAQRAD